MEDYARVGCVEVRAPSNADYLIFLKHEFGKDYRRSEIALVILGSKVKFSRWLVLKKANFI